MSRLWTGHRDIDLVCEIIFRKLQMYFSIFIFRFSKLNLVGIIIDRFRYQILLIIHKKWPNIHFCTIFWQWTIYEIYNRPKLGLFAPKLSWNFTWLDWFRHWFWNWFWYWNRLQLVQRLIMRLILRLIRGLVIILVLKLALKIVLEQVLVLVL